ncbi:hypothetical protein AT728_07185 [Streptomyces silvensis]|uniref:Uncharacterized protein n=1 Tax=Streptomyces silvensis TaxID=1765722 RepID=A0A0W7X7B4_9ACTN|nr:hypothetical protein AT728_07185 [Streptomyces silvensis]
MSTQTRDDAPDLALIPDPRVEEYVSARCTHPECSWGAPQGRTAEQVDVECVVHFRRTGHARFWRSSTRFVGIAEA